MIEEIVAKYAADMAVFLSTGATVIAAREVRKVRRKLDTVDKHDRILEGDDATGFPGLVEIVTDDDVEVSYSDSSDGQRRVKP